MQKNTLFILLGFLILCLNLTAQTVRVSGTVKDSLGNPLEMANVLAVDVLANGIASYSVTDAQGRYKLDLEIGKNYLIRSSYVGFTMFEEKLLLNEPKPIEKHIVMKPQNALDEVELIYEMPVVVKGDTIVYKADAFTTGNEKKLKDVLEKLPGFQVDKEGNVKVQGKDVSKVMVEGKDFFDGDTKTASKNLPADAVDKVEVLQNFNDVGPLGGVNDSDAIALNIKLKDGKKSMLFGDVSASGGHDERYTGHANLFLYKPKSSFNFIGDLNNIGEPALTLQDYFRFNGGFGGLSQRSGSSINIASDDAGFLPLRDNRAANIDSRFAGLNYTLNPNKKWNFSGFGMFLGNNTDLRSETSRTYLREDGNLLEELTEKTNQRNNSGQIKLTGKYKPTSRLEIRSQTFFKYADIDQKENQNSDFSGTVNTIASENKQHPLTFNQSLNAYFAQSDRHIFSFESQFLYKQQDPFFDLATTQRQFVGIIPTVDDEVFNLLQNRNVFTRKLDTRLSYYYVFNKKNHLNVTVGNVTANQFLGSSLTQLTTDGDRIDFTENALLNRFRYRFSDTYATVQLTSKLGAFELRPGVNVHFFNTSNFQFSDKQSHDQVLVLPTLNAKYNISKAHSLTLNYGIKAEYADVNSLASGVIINGYNTLFSGNRALDNQWYHQVSLNYFNFNSYNFSNIYGNISYSRRIDDITNTVRFENLERILTTVNAASANDILSGSATYEKRFRKFKTNLTTNISYSKINNSINDLENTNRTLTQNYKASVESNFKDSPNVEIGFETTNNFYTGSQTTSRFVTDSPFASIEIPFLKNFLFEADYTYNNYKNRSQSTSTDYDFLNARLTYSQDKSSWEFYLYGTNLTNTTSINNDSFNDFIISTNRYIVQPRYVLFGVKFKI
ncbi:MAG: carboxypeptidase-like regulatory domain-containing protein [Bacteroidetes bacterium]|nr:carboxypeptidase-like regulatory domain-containing protein [Bacteroidota bacterium]